MSEFTGWPKDAMAFLRDLEANNEREWFHEHRARYEAALAEPARLLGADLADLGRPKVFRPFNDTRFHSGPPIKEHVGLAIGYEGAGGWYVELSLDGLFIATGQHVMQSDQVERLRAAVADGRKAGALSRALEHAQEAGLELGEPALKRVPRGYPADHPRADLLRQRRMVVALRDPKPAWVHRKGAAARIRATLEAGTPLVKWIRTHVGPSEKTYR